MKQLIAIEELVKSQRDFFLTGVTKNVDYRIKALKKLKEVILSKEERICEALKKDLNKSPMESYMAEVGMTLSELNDSIKHVRTWAKAKHVPSPLAQFHAKSFIMSEPYGVTLIMSPWNYPFLLCLEPMIGAIAAGNCCILKPSNYSPHTSAIIREIIEDCFLAKYVTVVEGGREENTLLLEQKFDYIFFTGGVSVGKLVMEKAAQNLTPVTLELGGKSPCIIDKSANLKMAAKRVVFGKFLNSGQTCVAPDYALVQEEVQEEFIKYVTFYTKKMYGQDAFENIDYPKMINLKHYQRVLGLIEPQNVVFGGVGKEETLQIAPTLLTGITAQSTVMQEEIFGPILPIIRYKRLEEAERFILERPKPLACYIFTTNKAVEARLLRNLSFGGGCINDTIIHLATSRMGFGGVGESGMGSYHGKISFDTFSHKKSIVKKYNWIDLPIRYQPYTKINEKLVRLFLR
jgi:aldehyde dehydrogenase (NAD+)